MKNTNFGHDLNHLEKKLELVKPCLDSIQGPQRKINPEEELARYSIIIENYKNKAEGVLNLVEQGELYLDLTSLSECYDLIIKAGKKLISEKDVSLKQVLSFSNRLEDFGILIENIEHLYRKNILDIVGNSLTKADYWNPLD